MLSQVLNFYDITSEDIDHQNAISDFIGRLVNKIGMRFLFNDENSATPVVHRLWVVKILRYLNQQRLDQRPVTSRMLGAFSFCVNYSNVSSIDIDGSGKHFILLNPEYAGVYANFGGKLSDKISTQAEMRLYEKFKLDMTDYRQKTFSREILNLLGDDAAYYYFPVPRGEDFVGMKQRTIDAYISASIGPRMLFDTTGPVSSETISSIVKHCWGSPEIIPWIPLFSEIYSHVRTAYIDVKQMHDIATLLQDSSTVNAIETYGRAFRLGWLPTGKLQQVFGLPVGMHMTTQLYQKLVNELFSPDGEFMYDVLDRRTRNITKAYVTSQKVAYDGVFGECKVVVLGDIDYTAYAPIDLFIYTSATDGGTMYVTTTGDTKYIAVGKGIDVDESIEESALRAWEYAEDHSLLFPPKPVVEMARFLIEPEHDMLAIFNSIITI